MIQLTVFKFGQNCKLTLCWRWHTYCYHYWFI